MIEQSGSAASRASPDIDEMSTPAIKPTKGDVPLRKVICRYGHGCTHMLDQAHREKFWHPQVAKLNDEMLKSHYVCDECGYSTSSLPNLVIHLKRKTAWSNTSLVGCRVNCLVDMKEWHEGYVSQYHKSGKHYVEFRQASIRRWLNMKKVAFYIIERPSNQSGDSSEYKDSDGDTENLAPAEEEKWVYSEDISLDYAYAQSVLFKVYGNTLQETGHLTRGHVALTESDKAAAASLRLSLLYGELLPRGANKALGARRLEAHRATSLYDLGMGTGKVVLQAFLQFRNLAHVVGVELSRGRYRLAEEAALRLVQLLGAEHFRVQLRPGDSVTITTGAEAGAGAGAACERRLHLQCGDLFDVAGLGAADVVMMETDVPADLHGRLQALLGGLREGARVLTYLDLRRAWDGQPLPFRQLEANRAASDRYATSWSVQRGHHFFLWTRLGHDAGWPGRARGGGAAAHAAGDAAGGGGGAGGGDGDGDGQDSHRGAAHRSREALDGQAAPQTSRCLPLRLFGWGRRGPPARKAALEPTEASLVNCVQGERAVIPVNADGSRACLGSASSGRVGSASSPGPAPLPGPSPGPASPRRPPPGGGTIVAPADPQAGVAADCAGPVSAPAAGLLDFPADIRSRLRASPSPAAPDSPRPGPGPGPGPGGEAEALRTAVCAAAAGGRRERSRSRSRSRSLSRSRSRSRSRSGSPRAPRMASSRAGGGGASPPPFCAAAEEDEGEDGLDADPAVPVPGLVPEPGRVPDSGEVCRPLGRRISSRAALREATAPSPGPDPDPDPDLDLDPDPDPGLEAAAGSARGRVGPRPPPRRTSAEAACLLS